MGLPDNSSSPIRFTPSKDSNYSSSESGRPTGSAGSRKDFKKVLEKSDDDESQGGGQASKVSEEEGEAAADQAIAAIGKKRGPPSLFDLTATAKPVQPKQTRPDTGGDVEIIERDDTVESPNALYSKMNANTGEMRRVGRETADDGTGAALLDVPVKKEPTTRFSTEQTDLSYVNPMAAVNTQAAPSVTVKAEKPVLPASNIQEIINQMVSQVTEIKDTGRTETIVTLKHPPLFAGANIVVTAFDSAKGEFNITFENLTQAAKNILDMQSNKDSLLLALQEKGYNVHILTATTLSENRPVVEEGQTGKQAGQQNQQAFGQQGRQGRQKGEDQG